MAVMIGPECFEYEKEIIWLDDPSKYPWVRQSSGDFPKKQGISNSSMLKISRNKGKIIGYANLEDEAPPSFIENTGRKYYWRRVFYLNDEDYKNYQDRTSYPMEAVDPSRVTPKEKGYSPWKKF